MAAVPLITVTLVRGPVSDLLSMALATLSQPVSMRSSTRPLVMAVGLLPRGVTVVSFAVRGVLPTVATAAARAMVPVPSSQVAAFFAVSLVETPIIFFAVMVFLESLTRCMARSFGALPKPVLGKNCSRVLVVRCRVEPRSWAFIPI